ncbi:cupin domain-containing protein [Paenibacillus sp. MWE-103]|uniref:Cupin domain-containing protein n=1 Tax=Paenibacillus artemisiicola TaxID=1172618 RepID=A0ABS3W3T2_9BACL|nr:cupin domain-containing protein [Paenibacillus artemisiicola]MBO7742971.1 cupin domain-containing protein [Paenibacillus artemisiicola]
MANASHAIVNPHSGQRMIFRKTGKDTNGEMVEIESFNPSSAQREPMHIHPKQMSSCEVLAGIVHFHADGKTHVLKAGDKLEIPAGVPHYFWNEDPEEAHTIQRFYPALDIDGFFASYFALARTVKIGKSGTPSLLRMARPALHYRNEIRIVNPPWPVQRALFSVLAPIAGMLGYPKTYT